MAAAAAGGVRAPGSLTPAAIIPTAMNTASAAPGLSATTQGFAMEDCGRRTRAASMLAIATCY